MNRTISFVALSLAVAGAAACKKEEKGGGEAAGAVKEPAGKAPAVKPGSEPKPQGVKATLAGKDVGALYGVAQQDLSFGNTYALSFASTPITCADLTKEQPEDVTQFSIYVYQWLKPDGSLGWAYRQIAFGLGATAPANAVEMPAFAAAAGKVGGTLPDGVTREGDARGELAVTGTFDVPLCDPIPARKPTDFADIKKDAPPIEPKASTAKVSVAGKAFDVHGATVVPSLKEGEFDLRLTEAPHGCTFDAPGDLVVTLRIGGDAPVMFVGGNWLQAWTDARDTEGLTIDAKQVGDAFEVSLGGAKDFDGYKVELSGAVTAPLCAATP